MADETSKDAFKVLGQIEVDLNALNKSFDDAKKIISGKVGEIRTIMDSASANGGVLAGGGGGKNGDNADSRGENGGMVKGARTAGREFTHLARIAREVLAGPLIALDPAFAKFANASLYAARSATFLGVGLGAVVVAGVAVAEVLGAYLKKAQEATTQTLDFSQSLKLLDPARAEASLKKAAEAVAEYSLQEDIAAGKVEAGFWQKLLAWSAITAEAVTGNIDRIIRKYGELVTKSVEIAKKTTFKEQDQKSSKDAADLLQKQSERARQNAHDEAGVAASYVMSRKALQDKHDAEIKYIDDVKRVKSRAAAESEADDQAKTIEREAAKNKAKREMQLETQFGGGEGIDLTMSEETKRKARAESDKQYGEDMERARMARVAGQVKAGADERGDLVERDTLNKKFSDDMVALREKERKDLAQLAADREGFVQREIAANQKRLESAVSTAEAVAASEDEVRKVRLEHAGEAETSSTMEVRLARTRENTVGPLLAGIKSATAAYESQRRALQGLIAENVNAVENEQKLAELERTHSDDMIERLNKVAQVRAGLNAKEEQERAARNQAEVAAEDRRLAHAVAMGRASQQTVMSSAAQGMNDPRRTQAEREQQEEKLFSTKKEYAEQYFKLYQELGASTWRQELQQSQGALSQMVVGSTQWFDQVAKIADKYKEVHDQAKGILQQEVGIAESKAREHGRTTIAMKDVDKYVREQRKIDDKAMRGGRVKIGELSGAIGRQDMWKTVDREGLSPNEAFSRMQQDPQRQLIDALQRTATVVESTFGDKSSGVGGLSDAAKEAGGALGDLSKAAADATLALGSIRDGGLRTTAPAGSFSQPGVLASNGDASSGGVSTAVDASLGRNLQLASRRGPNTVYTNAMKD